ncbi:CocE/NonD family hydrolase [Gilvimarinus sp. F26214L]|uniref:CocE/NonD family hydrolase n=1 Tax=Gilvimarinus sp. DZF01 TaxID=3461371 RepID=UPI004045900B
MHWRDHDSFPNTVRTVEHLSIPLPDGQQLAARLWLPSNAETQPVPAIIEYLPYRKRDLTRRRDEMIHPYLAGHGYACLRVDMRGSGDADGVLRDQYRLQEQQDGLRAIEWAAQQPWCDGAVGMMGISWGGFNALQIAALRPPALKAVISACSTEDLYRDNMHYMGGCLLTDNLSESTTMFSVNSCPPDPALVGERWREMWMERLEGSGLWLDIWLRHQRRDDYWRHGSVCEDYSRIQCPVLAIGGWADGYTNAIFRLMEHLEVPRQALIGPWGHKYPHLGIPGPAIGFLQEALRWWDHWLKGRDTGIEREPLLRAWMQESVPPTTYYQERPGRWVAEPEWPSPGIRSRRFWLASGHMLCERRNTADEGLAKSVQSPLSVGLFAGKWCSYTAAPDLPHDQREEDGGALVFQSEPLSEDLEFLGSPELDAVVTASESRAMMAVRLSDVAPDDKATRITYGLLNLCHRDGHDRPEALIPGQKYRVRVPLNHVAQTIPAGHRLRVSISTSYWPLAWAPPRPTRLEVLIGESSLTLPVREPRPDDDRIAFPAPEASWPGPSTQLEEPEHNWLVHRDLAADLSMLEVIKDDGRFRIDDIDLEVTDRTWDWYTFQNDDFSSLRGETRSERVFAREDWRVRTTTRTVLTCDESTFFIHAELDAWEGDKRVYSRNWDRRIPRDHM